MAERRLRIQMLLRLSLTRPFDAFRDSSERRFPPVVWRIQRSRAGELMAWGPGSDARHPAELLSAPDEQDTYKRGEAGERNEKTELDRRALAAGHRLVRRVIPAIASSPAAAVTPSAAVSVSSPIARIS